MYLGELQYFTGKTLFFLGVGSLSGHEYRILMICLFVDMGILGVPPEKATPLFDNNKKTNSVTS